MILRDEKNIQKEIKNPGHLCYYLDGDDSYLIGNYTNLLIKNLKIKTDDDFNFHEFTSPETTSEIINTLYTLPVFKDKRVILLKNFNAGQVSSEDLLDFKEVFSDYPKESILIISNFSSNINAGILKFNKDIKNLFDELGVVFEIKTRAQTSVIGWISSYLKRSDCEISKLDARWVSEQNNNELSSIKVDLDKLIAFQRQGIIESETVKLLISPSLETSIFMLSRAINNRNYHQSITIIEKFKKKDEEPIMILNTLYSYYNDILRAKSALNEGLSEKNIKENFMYKGREFLISNAIRDSKRISWNFLENAIETLFAADINSKKSEIEPYFLLETIVTKLFLLKQEFQ